MRRLFALDLSMRSTACNYDPCIVSDERGKPSVLCDDCKVTFISDRFLGEDFQRKVLGRAFEKSLQKYTYVIIADVVGCNLNCWFCYAWRFLKKSEAEKSCLTSYTSAERLAEQFFCKFKKVSSTRYMIEQIENKKFLTEDDRRKSIKHIELNLPLSRIRISGGEPIFSDGEVLLGRDEKKTIHLANVEYWLTFFKKLDELVGKLKVEDVVHLVDVDKWDGSSPHLTCLSEVTGRLNVRFDTNGILFANEEITDAFVGGLYRLYKESKLNNLFIQIDYSIKGATPTEYHWSQSLSLPVSPDKNNPSFSAKEHPQYFGYRNIVDAISSYVGKDAGFDDCIGITVEKGIDHERRYSVFLYYPEALDWKNFSNITGMGFSPVINCFDLNFRWRTSAKIYRYSKRGAVIRMRTENNSVDSVRNTVEELLAFQRLHRDDPSFKALVYPTGVSVGVRSVRKPKREHLQVSLDTYRTVFGWILSGDAENWKIALRHNLWGVVPELKPLWEQMKKGDLLFFYATRPVSGIIGMANVEETIEEKTPLWPNEIRQGKVKYPYRIRFELAHMLKEADWKTRHLSLRNVNVMYYRGLNAIHDEATTRKLTAEAKKIFE